MLDSRMISVFVRDERDDWRKFLAGLIIGFIDGNIGISISVAFRNFAKRRLSVANADVDLRNTYRMLRFH